MLKMIFVFVAKPLSLPALNENKSGSVAGEHNNHLLPLLVL